MHILQKIVKHKIEEVNQHKSLYPIALLEKSIYYKSPALSMSNYIQRDDKSGIIAEFKRRSPSKPEINVYADVESVTIGYMQGGASGLSVLTDNHFFGGSNKDLSTARKFNFCPILRKDFIIDEYQVYEARSIGADIILLIAEILSKEQVTTLSSLAQSLGMEVLMELHSSDQLNKVCDTIDIIGINNRNLKTFKTDIQFSIDLFQKLPGDFTKISESGIHHVSQILQLREVGYDGFLIGEQFMVHDEPGKACKDFVDAINKEYAH